MLLSFAVKLAISNAVLYCCTILLASFLVMLSSLMGPVCTIACLAELEKNVYFLEVLGKKVKTTGFSR